jgi:hypothetical protein
MSTSDRRSYGSGSLSQRADSTGALTWYGHVRVDGRRRKRALGRVEQKTKREAEAALRGSPPSWRRTPLPRETSSTWPKSGAAMSSR